jgi:hypothetical protein
MNQPSTNPSKSLARDPEDTRTLGDYGLCAWATSENTCRIQTSDPGLVKELRKLPDCSPVGYGVTGPFLRLFAIPYTLSWVSRNVIQNFTHKFPRKTVGQKTETAQEHSPEPVSTT